MTRLTAWLLVVAVCSCSACPAPAAPKRQPQPLCTQPHRMDARQPAPCSGVLVVTASALRAAKCSDVLLPRCEAKRARAAVVADARAAQLALEVSATRTDRDRLRGLATRPCPPAVTRVVIRETGWSRWAVAVVAVVAVAAGAAGGYAAGARRR